MCIGLPRAAAKLGRHDEAHEDWLLQSKTHQEHSLQLARGRASLCGCVRRNLGMRTPCAFSRAPSLVNNVMAAPGSKQARAARSMPMTSASFSCFLQRTSPQRPLSTLLAMSGSPSSRPHPRATHSIARYGASRCRRHAGEHATWHKPPVKLMAGPGLEFGRLKMRSVKMGGMSRPKATRMASRRISSIASAEIRSAWPRSRAHA